MQTEVTILGGLSVTIQFSLQAAEPEVGIMNSYVEDWEIVAIAGRKLRKAEKCDWLYRRIDAKKGEEAKIMEACAMASEDFDGRDFYDYEH